MTGKTETNGKPVALEVNEVKQTLMEKDTPTVLRINPSSWAQS
jgi:hypothetical protein